MADVIVPVRSSSLHRSVSIPGTTAALAITIFTVVVALQWTHGAYQAEFGAHPDEAAHYVTGLMVRDYIAAGMPRHPMAYAQNYYNHYPKVALGNWPPLFYLIQAAWTLPFSAGRSSVLLLMALLTCLVALLVVRVLWRDRGVAYGLLGGAVFLAFPLVQQHAGMVMTEIPVALLSFAATICFARFLERGRTADSVLFGLFASAAIMTKGSALALALMPPVALLITGRFDVLKRLNFWYPVPIVAVLGGPWTWLFRHVAADGWQEAALSWRYTGQAATHFPGVLAGGASLVITVFAIIGMAAAIVGARRGKRPAIWAVAAAQVLAVLTFHAVIPASLDSRHVIQALPAWAILAVVGVTVVEERLPAGGIGWQWALWAVAVVGIVHTGWYAPMKQCRGFGAVVAGLVNRPENANAVFLVSSDATGEGMFIAETAMHEARPGHVVRRASKLLSGQAWNGQGYHALVHTESELDAVLTKQQVRFLVLDSSISASMLTPHHELLRKAAANPEHFALLGTYPLTRDYLVRPSGTVFPTGISVYETRSGNREALARSPAQ